MKHTNPIRSLFNTNVIDSRLSLALLLLRVGISAFMLTHGLAKLGKFSQPGPVEFGDPLHVGPTASLGLAVFAEVVCSVLLILGLATRLATIPLIITMVVAVLVVHQADSFGDKELALLYLLAYVVLFLTGPGKYSVDQRLQRS